eukprot:15100731-Heterocapsa_arctica.AAC.1
MGAGLRKSKAEDGSEEPGEAEGGEEYGSVNSRQLRAVPVAAGLWTTQVPPPGTGSAQSQDPSGSNRNEPTRSASPEPTVTAREPNAANASDSATQGPGKTNRQERPVSIQTGQGERARQDRRVRPRRHGRVFGRTVFGMLCCGWLGSGLDDNAFGLRQHQKEFGKGTKE